MTSYYAQKLAGERLRLVYELASPRVQQYLEAEIVHVRERLRAGDRVLELGCGYGRVAFRLAETAASVVGIDNAEESLRLARCLDRERTCTFLEMDALDLGFPDDVFDVVVCIQNGICAFGVDTKALALEALRVVRPEGRVMFSSYSDRFWEERLAWFEAQAAAGLIGPIDRVRSGGGVIVTRDGFRAGRMTPRDFVSLCAALGLSHTTEEVDGSSVFCELVKPERARV